MRRPSCSSQCSKPSHIDQTRPRQPPRHGVAEPVFPRPSTGAPPLEPTGGHP